MKTRAAVMWEGSGPYEVCEIDVYPPQQDEVLVRYDHAGLCHTDEHLRSGDITFTPPMVGGHEGSGVVEEVGPGVTHLNPGDHFVTSWMPYCGRCRFCVTGHTNLCDNGQYLMSGTMLDGTQRLHGRGVGIGSVDLIGTFAQYNVIPASCVVTIDDDLPLETVAIAACGVPTGWGSAINAAEVTPGDTAIVYGIGGIGINAIQGCAHAGAAIIVAVDPVELKRETALSLGATHAFASAEEAHEFLWAETRGVGADAAILTVGLMSQDVMASAFSAIRKGGVVVVTAVANPDLLLQIPSFELTLYQKRVVGSLFGSGNPHHDIRRILDLYKRGIIKLDELITNRYSLDEVNLGYDDMLAGKNIRGVLDIAH